MFFGLRFKKIKLLEKHTEDIKADNRYQLQNDTGRLGRL